MVDPFLTNGGEDELDRLSEIAGNRTEQERSTQQVNKKLIFFCKNIFFMKVIFYYQTRMTTFLNVNQKK